MKYKILGHPFQREEFKINYDYRGIFRNEIPEPKFKDNSTVEFLENLYETFISSDNNQMPIYKLLEIADSFRKFSTEPFELIIVKNIKESIPENILYNHLGYEVLANNEASMIHFWLRKKVEGFGNLYETHVKRLNNNYLFSSVEDSECFIRQIKQYVSIISPSADFEIDFEIIEIIRVEGIR